MSNEYKNIVTQLHEGILTVTISRPQSLNALNQETLHEMEDVLNEIYASPEIKGVIITGAGEKSFVAGADINELSKLDTESGLQFSMNGHALFFRIENCPKPVIAAINGFALGGGCELAMACHIRIAVSTAIFGQPEVNLGVIPGYGGTQRLTKLVGAGNAIEIMATGDHIKAEEALRIGLINHLCSSRDEMMEKSIQILQRILSRAPLAVSMVIDAVNSYYKGVETGYKVEAENFAKCLSTQDFKEGTKAFLEKRKPNFQGK